MSDQTEIADEKTTPKPLSLTVAEALQFIRDNFVLVSAAALLIGVALATTFITAYLSVFDWHLIWFVQYTDIITFGLLAVGIVSGSVTALQGIAQMLLGGKTPKQKRTGFIIVVLLAIAGMAISIWGAARSGEGYFHILFGFVAFGTAVALIYIIAEQIEARALPTAMQCMSMMLLLVMASVALGRWLGESVEETSDFNQDIYLKDQPLNDVKLVIVMSRHTVLLKDSVLNVVPTGDITKFRTVDKQAKPPSIPGK